MRRAQANTRAALLPVRISEGETVQVTASLVFADDGALLRVVPPPPEPGRADPREFAARRLLARLDAEMARPRGADGGGVGVCALRRELELLVQLSEQLEDVESRLGPVVARTQRLGPVVARTQRLGAA